MLDFIQKINYYEITLSEINANIVNKKPFFDKMLEAVDPQFKIRDKENLLKQSLEDFKRIREMHQYFLSQAATFYLPVKVQQYLDELNMIKSNYDKITIKEAMDLKQKPTEESKQGTTIKKAIRWDLTNKKFVTIETFFHFKHSEVFPRVLKLMDTVTSQPLKKKPTMVSIALTSIEMTIEDFDQMCQQQLIEGTLKDFISKLKQYPDEDPLN